MDACEPIVLIAFVLGVATGAFLEASMVLWRINSMEARKLENYLSVKKEIELVVSFFIFL